jgi:hypothetical protein
VSKSLKLLVFFIAAILAMLLQPIISLANYTETPQQQLQVIEYYPSAEPSPSVDLSINNCWDCDGSTMTEEEKLAAACTPAMLRANPQHLDLCFPDKYVWTCEPDGACEFRTPGPTPYNGLDVPTTPPSTEPVVPSEQPVEPSLAPSDTPAP